MEWGEKTEVWNQKRPQRGGEGGGSDLKGEEC